MSKKSRRAIPKFETPIIETHCHLDYLDPEELELTLARAREVGVERIVTIAVSPGNLDRVLALAHHSDDIWGTQGVHPHEAEAYTDEVEQLIRERCQNPRIVAVGEIGQDYHYDHADRSVQRNVFERQLQIAVDLKMPVVIHTREADQDTQSILSNFSGQLSTPGVIHSFTSGMALAQYCMQQGFFIGFNGITTFNSAENVRAIVAATPLDKIVLETDAPYLTPMPYRGRPNAPFYLPFIAEKIAQIKSCTVECLLAQARENSLSLFFQQTA